MLQSVLVERPTAVLPFLVEYTRGREHNERREEMAVKLRSGKLLSNEEMELLRGPVHKPMLDDAFALLEVVDPIDRKLQSGLLLSAAEVRAPPHLHFSAPLRLCAPAPPRLRANAPVRQCVSASVRQCANA